MNSEEYLKFKEYWRKYCPDYNRVKARIRWNMHLETEKVSTDMNVNNMVCIDDYMTNTTPMAVAWSQVSSFAPSTSQVCNAVPCATKADYEKYIRPITKGNNPMYVDNDKHIESSKINYLSGRLENIEWKKTVAIRKQFGLENDDAPQSAADLVARIQAGKFILNDNKDKNTYDPARMIVWRDPAVKEDMAGYKLAADAFNVAKTATQDTIAIDTPANALVAVKALEAWTYTAPTTAVPTA